MLLSPISLHASISVAFCTLLEFVQQTTRPTFTEAVLLKKISLPKTGQRPSLMTSFMFGKFSAARPPPGGALMG